MAMLLPSPSLLHCNKKKEKKATTMAGRELTFKAPDVGLGLGVAVFVGPASSALLPLQLQAHWLCSHSFSNSSCFGDDRAME
jgi:hypothetical protein